jgi:hypothetical protein
MGRFFETAFLGYRGILLLLISPMFFVAVPFWIIGRVMVSMGCGYDFPDGPSDQAQVPPRPPPKE